VRLKAALGGYDGRSQVRIGTRPSAEELAAAFEPLRSHADAHGLLVERELRFEAELSVIVARGVDGTTLPYSVVRNVHDDGILVESAAPAAVPVAVSRGAQELAASIATELDLEGVLTVELFLLGDGSLAVNELAPRVHNSGHWTVDAARTSQFEQHIRAICGLPLGSADQHSPAALVNILGEGSSREARIAGLGAALADPLVHVSLYDKRRVFERRKMGHVVATGASADEALARARRARAALSWLGPGGAGEPSPVVTEGDTSTRVATGER
jgi:5-(carboxyamino)imidazole ribonucleotide synthase